MKKILCLIVILSFVFSTSMPAFAASGPDYWYGGTDAYLGDYSDNWSDLSTNNPPLTGDSWVFDAAGASGATLNNNFTSYSVAGITFDSDASPFTINGNSIALTGNIANNSAYNQIIGMPISSGTVTNSGTGSGNVTINSDIGSGVTAVTQDSATSTLILSGSNTYSGATTVSSGILNLQSNGALSGSGATVASGGTLQLEGGITTSAIALTLNGTGVSSNGSLENVSGNNTYAGLVTLGSSAQINSDSGTLTLSNTGTITGSGDDLTVGGSGNTTIDSIIGTGAATLSKEGSGTLTLTGADTFTGNTTVSAGVLNIQNANALGTGAGSASVASGATLQIQGGITTAAEALTLNGTGVSNNGALESVSGNNTYAGLITLGGNTQINADSGSSLTLSNTGSVIGAGNALTVAGSGNTTIDSVLNTTLGSLIKSGTGTLTLTGDDTYTGTTILNAGTLNLGSSSALGSGTISFDGGTLQYSGSNNTDYSNQFSTASGQAFNIDTNGQNVTFANGLDSTGGSLIKIGSGTLILTGANSYSGTTISGGTLQIGNGGSTGNLGSGAVVDNSNLTFDLTSNINPSNIISGTGSVTQNGSGILTLAGANTYTGATTVNTGTLEAGIVNQAFGIGSAVSVGSSATLDLGGFNETIGALAGTGGTVTNSGGSSAILTVDENAPTTFSGNIQNGASTVGLTKEGSGILILNGDNSYSGATTLDAGTLNLGSINAIGAGTIYFNGGTLQYSGSNNTDYSAQFSTANNQAYSIDTNGENVTFADALDSTGGSLTKIGSGTLTLSVADNYSGATTIDGGTLQIGNAGAIPVTSDVSIASGATLDLAGNSAAIGSLAGAGTVTSSAGSNITLTAGGDNSSTDFSGIIQNGSATSVGFIKEGIGTLDLSGSNTYSGGTTISGGTLQVGNSNALGTGAVVNNAALNLGTTNLSLGSGAYTQNAGSTLELTADSASTVGEITSAVAASVASGSTIKVTVGGDIANGTSLEVINTGGAGITGADPTTITLDSSIISFSSSIVDGNLFLTADNTGFARLADNANARAIGTVLDNITNPSSDMSNVLGQLAMQSSSGINSALNTMGPVIDGGVIQDSSATLNGLVSATLDRIQNNLDHAASGNAAGTGIASGDAGASNSIWAKPYGSYLSQGTLQGIQGYDAWNAGTVVGYDHMITDDFTLGVSGGYAYGMVNSDANNATTDISSAQGTIYAGYQDPNLNYFIDAAGSFAWNWYDGQRDISVGDINRTADADYNGQQYGTYVDGGYKFNVGGSWEFTPLASLQWTHLTLDSYTETNAGALDLNVNSQNYDMLESGLGASIAYPQQFGWGDFTPEFHAKWLYDFIDDDMVVTSSFTGGGASFTSTGATPSREGADIGGKLSFDFNNDLSLIAGLDAELKDQFFGIYGSGTLRYKF